MKLKKPSKRMPLARKYNLQRKTSEKKRKIRKLAKKNKNEIRKTSRLRELKVHIPNKCPFKGEILFGLKLRRQKLLEAKKIKQDLKKESKQEIANDIKTAPDEEDLYDKICQKAKEAQDNYFQTCGEKQFIVGVDSQEYLITTKPRQQEVQTRGLKENKYYSISRGSVSRRNHLSKVFRVILEADVILYVTDARDPLNCIDLGVISHISSLEKKLIICLNKIDLIPSAILHLWLSYFRTYYPTVALKCVSSRNKERHFSSNFISDMKDIDSIRHNSSIAVGMDVLMQLLKNYSRDEKDSVPELPTSMTKNFLFGNKNMFSNEHESTARQKIKKNVSVGVVGYPNVGKSSIMQGLSRSKVITSIDCRAGSTKEVQYVNIDKQITMIDVPGVVMEESDDDPAVALRNAISIENVKDPEGVVEFLVQHTDSDALAGYYSVEKFTNYKEFLRLVAIRTGKLLKGGLPNYDAAARLVLTFWTSGRIPYFTLPPSNSGGLIGDCERKKKTIKYLFDDAIVNNH